MNYTQAELDRMAFDATWDIGHLNKEAIWSAYIVFNYVGSFLCIILFVSVRKMNNPNSSDIFISGLCSGCVWMSLTCGSQCLASVIHGYFYGENLACDIEAFFHVSSIIVQFFCVAMISVRSLRSVLTLPDFSIREANIVVLVIWLIACLGTYGMGRVSPIYLMRAGTYCFYEFKSPAIAMWLVPCLALSLSVMVFCYFRIFQVARAAENSVAVYRQARPAPSGNQSPEPSSASVGPSRFALQQRVAQANASAYGVGSSAALASSANLNHNNNNNNNSAPTATSSPASPVKPERHSKSVAVSFVTQAVGGTLKNLNGGTRTPTINPAPPRFILPSRRSSAGTERPMREPVQPPRPTNFQYQVAKKSALFTIVLLVGWIFAAITAIYELTVGPATEALVTGVGTGGTFHSVMVPLAYGYSAPYHRRTLKRFFRCRLFQRGRWQVGMTKFEAVSGGDLGNKSDGGGAGAGGKTPSGNYSLRKPAPASGQITPMLQPSPRASFAGPGGPVAVAASGPAVGAAGALSVGGASVGGLFVVNDSPLPPGRQLESPHPVGNRSPGPSGRHIIKTMTSNGPSLTVPGGMGGGGGGTGGGGSPGGSLRNELDSNIENAVARLAITIQRDNSDVRRPAVETRTGGSVGGGGGGGGDNGGGDNGGCDTTEPSCVEPSDMRDDDDIETIPLASDRN